MAGGLRGAGLWIPRQTEYSMTNNRNRSTSWKSWVSGWWQVLKGFPFRNFAFLLMLAFTFTDRIYIDKSNSERNSLEPWHNPHFLFHLLRISIQHLHDPGHHFHSEYEDSFGITSYKDVGTGAEYGAWVAVSYLESANMMHFKLSLNSPKAQ